MALVYSVKVLSQTPGYDPGYEEIRCERCYIDSGCLCFESNGNLDYSISAGNWVTVVLSETLEDS